jgi:hypothetical protein
MLTELAAVVAPKIGMDASVLWPPSAASAPFLTTLWAVLASLVYHVFVLAEGDTAIHEVHKKKRRDAKLRTLKSIVVLEEARLARLAKKAGGEKKETADDRVAAGNEKPPTAKRLFDALFERVEDQLVTEALGIPPDDPWFLRVVALFQNRVQAELSEAETSTTDAQAAGAPPVKTTPATLQPVADYADGEKLSRVIDFTRDEAIKHVGRPLRRLPRPGPGELSPAHVLDLFESAYAVDRDAVDRDAVRRDASRPWRRPRRRWHASGSRAATRCGSSLTSCGRWCRRTSAPWSFRSLPGPSRRRSGPMPCRATSPRSP